jgi:hypothetical protein
MSAFEFGREAVLFPPKKGGNGNRSLRQLFRNCGNRWEHVEQVCIFPSIDLFRRLETGVAGNSLFPGPEKGELFPSLGTVASAYFIHRDLLFTRNIPGGLKGGAL